MTATLPMIVLGQFTQRRVVSLSRERPDALVLSTLTSWVAYRGHACRMDTSHRRMLVALFVQPGRVVSRAEMIDACYGDDEDGGPQDMSRSLSMGRQVLSFVCAMVGARLARSNGGWCVEPLEARSGAA